MKDNTNIKSFLNPIFAERERRDKKVVDVKEHVHNFYELYFLTDGQIDEFVENRTHHLKAFDIVIVKPNVLHRVLPCDDTRHERVIVYFDRRSISDKEILKSLDEQHGVISLPESAAKRVFELADILIDETENEMFHESYARAVLAQMLIVIFRNQSQKTGEVAGAKFKKIIDYVRENSREDITLASVAKLFSLSEAHLSRIFKKNTGFTFTQYVNYQRIIYSQKLLLTSDASIGEVAQKSGFDSLTSFGRVFRQTHGCTPRDYRKNAKTDI